MRFQNWRWWQWVVASVVVGGAVGFALTRLDPDDPSLPSTSFSAMRAKLERRTEAGESILTNIRVGPVLPDHSGKPVQSVTFWERQRNRNTGQWDPTLPYRTVTPVPLSPKSPTATFGVLDYLAERRQDIPTLNYRYQWWLEPRNIWLLSLAGSVLLIGVLWPMLLKGMIRLGLAEPPEQRVAGLGAVRTTDESPVMSTGVAVTADDHQKLADLNAELEANVAGMRVNAGDAAAADQSSAAADPVKLQTERPAEPTIAAKAGERPENYKGEFYPVSRPVTKKD